MKIYRDYLRYKTSENKVYNFIKTLLYPSFIAIVFFRFADGIYHLNKKIFYFPAKLIMLIPRVLFGIDISIGAEIGEGFMIAHGCGVVIGSNVILGKNILILQQVTIGGNHNKRRTYKLQEKIIHLDMPLIEDNCILSPGCKLLGPIIIGENSLIGANVVLTRDVPKNSKVLGNTPVIISI